MLNTSGLFFLALTSCGLLMAQENRRVSTERFELDYNPSAGTASAEYGAALAQSKSVQSNAQLDCRSERFKRAKSASEDWGVCRFLPPFPLETETSYDPAYEPVFGWAPASEVPGSPLQIQRWNESAGKGLLDHCEDSVCEIVVHALKPPPNEETLAVCKIVSQTGVAEGAPWDCRPVAIITRDIVWVSVIRAYTQVGSRTLGLPDFDFALITPNLLEMPSFLAGLERALGSEPLNLSTKLQARTSDHGTLFGTSQYKASKVLQDYRPRLREIATVRVDAFEGRKQEFSYVMLSVSTNLLVNTLASTDPADWHMPSPPQAEDYVNAVRDSLKKKLEQMCDHPRWKSDRVLACALPDQVKLPAWAIE